MYRACLVVGGLSNKVQEAALRRHPDIVVATPGRIIDHLRNAQSFTLETVDILVLDEADRLLSLGFSDELEQIIKFCPENRQTLLFSATMTEEVCISPLSSDLLRSSRSRWRIGRSSGSALSEQTRTRALGSQHARGIGHSARVHQSQGEPRERS